MPRAGVTRPPPASAADIRRLLAFYRETTYRVALPDGTDAALRIGAPLPAPVVAWLGGDGGASYLTACNPYSQRLDARANTARLERLRDALAAAGYRWLEGAGELASADWYEPSLLVAPLPDPVLDRLARTFEQNAALTIRGGGAPRLRVFRAEWRYVVGRATDADIDWA